jgi:hypothetical protein
MVAFQTLVFESEQVGNRLRKLYDSERKIISSVHSQTTGNSTHENNLDLAREYNRSQVASQPLR